jgi:hypothetical protein
MLIGDYRFKSGIWQNWAPVLANIINELTSTSTQIGQGYE